MTKLLNRCIGIRANMSRDGLWQVTICSYLVALFGRAPASTPRCQAAGLAFEGVNHEGDYKGGVYTCVVNVPDSVDNPRLFVVVNPNSLPPPDGVAGRLRAPQRDALNHEVAVATALRLLACLHVCVYIAARVLRSNFLHPLVCLLLEGDYWLRCA